MDFCSEPVGYTPEIYFGVFCPLCPERNDLTENANIAYCRDHREPESGDKDRVANPSGELYYPSVQEGGSDAGLCDFIHRGILSTDG